MNKVTCQQTHSANIHIVTLDDIGKVIPNCDGLLTNITNINISINTADCVPITINDTIKKVVGVIHAGWGGTEKEIIKKAINLMISKFNSDPKDIKIEIGPSIDKENYLVKSDVYKLFKKSYSKYFEKININQWKMDLKGINIDQLISTGILEENIKISKISTFLNNKYSSYRRDSNSKGFITSIMLK